METHTEWGVKIDLNKSEHLTTNLNVDDVLKNTFSNSVEEIMYLGSHHSSRWIMSQGSRKENE